MHFVKDRKGRRTIHQEHKGETTSWSIKVANQDLKQRHKSQFFFFQAEDGIRYGRVTGVQTCALPILADGRITAYDSGNGRLLGQLKDSSGNVIRILELWGLSFGGGTPANGKTNQLFFTAGQIGRASCRERV